VNSEDPTIRRRCDREAMNERDERAWKLQRQGLSVRAIARELGMPPSSVQRCLERVVKRQDASALGADDHLPVMVDTELYADEVADQPELWHQLNPLERYRLRHQPAALALVAEGHRLPPVHDEDHLDCCVRHGIDPDWRPDDDGGRSWREGVDRALADEPADSEW